MVEDVEHNEYISYVNRFEHNGFGLKFINNQFIFSFHISLLQRLLTEDFKKQLGEIKNDSKESKEQKTKKEQ